MNRIFRAALIGAAIGIATFVAFDSIIRRRARVQSESPAWADENETDPGITLVQLLSFLGENLIYRLDQATDRLVRLLRFLRRS